MHLLFGMNGIPKIPISFKLPKKNNFVDGWDFLMLYFTGENETGYARVSLAGMEWRLFCEPRRQEPLIHQ